MDTRAEANKIFDKVHSTLDQFCRWRLVLFCNTCATKVTPIVQHLASSEFTQLWNFILGKNWEGVLRHEHLNASVLLATLNARAETHEDDSHSPTYYVMRAIGILWYALNSNESPTAYEHAKWCSNGMFSFAADFDWAISKKTRSHLLGNTSCFIEWEGKMQNDLVDMLIHEQQPSESFNNKLHELAEAQSRILFGFLPEYCRVQGW